MFPVKFPRAFQLRRVAKKKIGSRDPFGAQHFPCKTRKKCKSQYRDPSGAWHFPSAFLHKIVPVTCPCEFRRRSHAQRRSLSPHLSGLRHFIRKFSRKIVFVKCRSTFGLVCAGSYKSVGSRSPDPSGARHCSRKFTRKVVLTCSCAF